MHVVRGLDPDPGVQAIVERYRKQYNALQGDVSQEVLAVEGGVLSTKTDVVRRQDAPFGLLIADCMAACFKTEQVRHREWHGAGDVHEMKSAKMA